MFGRKPKYPTVDIRNTRPSPFAGDGGAFYYTHEDTIVWKYGVLPTSVNQYGRIYKYAIIKLLIPRGTLVYLTDEKCRADKAICLQIKGYGKKECYSFARSSYDHNFYYAPGDKAKPRKKFSLAYKMCDSGIHFFRTQGEVKLCLKNRY